MALSQARLLSWNVTPLLDHRLLDLPWVGAGPGADLLGDVNALLSWLEQGHQLGDVLALLLWLQVAGLLGNLLDNSLLLVKAFLWAWLQLTSRWTAELTWHLLTFSFWSVLLDNLLLRGTDLLGPLGTLLLSGVSLGDVLTLLFLDGLASHNVILNLVLVVPGLALRLVDGLTFNWSLALADKWGVAELDLLLGSNLLVFDEAALDKVLLALLLLLWLKVSSVGGVALLAVAVLAADDIIVLGLFNHDNLVNASLASGGNGSNVQCNLISSSALTGCTVGKPQGVCGMGLMGFMFVVVVLVLVITVEWEGVPEVLSVPSLA